ncbi:PIG-L family deacetylase [Robertkochia aurantiaca]|uniref:PIG-L family deacetylase n=1 Tax=Robertkochia aurantiaca TaxID=2873700 RepID=UPI001CCEF80A|nr:PIG-L family deacetylase [Robertkochia sp. 3YJGBD-33]
MKRSLFSFLLGLVLSMFSYAQQPRTFTSTEIYEAVKKLNFLGSALYVAAHPDDENTRLIAFLSNEVKARTAYLSLTRGDGGQNLIGPELRELLGVLRTQELLEARRVDGGEQFFTRANDFGYSKHPEETLSIWNKDSVLADVVWAIRKFKPDVIINRFDHRTPGSTHGHHTSSAMLSYEAFDLAGNKNKFPSQLNYVDTWQPKRLFFNTSWWFYGSEENFEKADKSKMLSFDIGTYYPTIGMSNNEMASIASSQHLSQGFGRVSSRGSEKEYIELLKGDMPEDRLFEGINTSWTRVKGGEEINSILSKIEEEFNFKDPAVHVPELMKAYELITRLEDDHWREIKTKEITKIIQACSGLFLEATANDPSAVPGEQITLNLEAINRNGNSFTLKAVKVNQDLAQTTIDKTLESNTPLREELKLTLPSDIRYSTPYWLKNEGTLGMYSAPQRLIGMPESPDPVIIDFILESSGKSLVISKPLVYKYSRPDKGELYQPFEILPKATVSVSDKVFLFDDGKTKTVRVTVKAGISKVNGSVGLDLPEGWTSQPANSTFSIEEKGNTQSFIFSVKPGETQEGLMNAYVDIDGNRISKELVTIAYDHIPTQQVLLPSRAKVARLDITKRGEKIAYIPGAGDAVPESLKQIGYNVSIIEPEAITSSRLSGYDAVVVGIRAYNVSNEIRFKQPYLLEYVKNGGTLIVQYNTASRRGGLDFEQIAPYPLKVSRDRVTDEDAEVTFLNPDHPLLNTPNKITTDDFKGWVQERGLYFPDEWDQAFTPLLSMHDKNESPKKGSLLVAPYGKGYYIYTGLSFFRELPAGVPGAYKLFANMLSVGKEETQKTQPENDQTKG